MRSYKRCRYSVRAASLGCDTNDNSSAVSPSSPPLICDLASGIGPSPSQPLPSTITEEKKQVISFVCGESDSVGRDQKTEMEYIPNDLDWAEQESAFSGSVSGHSNRPSGLNVSQARVELRCRPQISKLPEASKLSKLPKLSKLSKLSECLGSGCASAVFSANIELPVQLQHGERGPDSVRFVRSRRSARRCVPRARLIEEIDGYKVDMPKKKRRRGSLCLPGGLNGVVQNEEKRTKRSNPLSNVSLGLSKPSPFGRVHLLNADNDLAIVTEHSTGLMEWVCKKCGALFFKSEAPRGVYKKCCREGRVSLDPLPVPPDFIQELFDSKTPKSRAFLRQCRNYNNALSLAATSLSLRQFKTSGPPCISVNGLIHHRAVPLLSEPGETPRFAQLFFVNPTEATRCRVGSNATSELDADILSLFDDFLRRENKFLGSYRMLHEYVSVNPTANVVLKIFDSATVRGESRISSVDEVAAVFTHEDGVPEKTGDVVVFPRGKKPTGIPRLSSLCDPLSYVVFFPTGVERGWNIQLSNVRSITCAKFYAYRLHVRQGDYNLLLRGSLLTSQFVVDAYMKVEETNLGWIRRNQSTLRAETYSGVHDFVHKKMEAENLKLGVLRVLPSSFSGSNRNMYRRYLDSMRLVQEFGCPSLFITVTCNPKWADILNNLHHPGEDPTHRYDLSCRVFRQKVDSIVSDIVDNSIFGKCVAYNLGVEFQMRGLPHIHMLVYLARDAKLRTSEEIDRVISAEFPDPSKDPELFETILRHNVHGPCGDSNPCAPCMENGECSKKFPRTFSPETIVDSNLSRVVYRRRKTDSVFRGSQRVDNSWVVPYSPYLSKKYNCHINVEACVSVNAVKYINKYINKTAFDLCTVKISDENRVNYDEIASFLDLRYIGPGEAIWRLFSFKMFEISHSIQLLAVHLERQNVITFEPGKEREALRMFRDTTLTAWFELNNTSDEARELRYTEIISLFRFDDGTKKWLRRSDGRKQRFKPLARLAMVSPLDKERYSLRLLLLHVSGAKSFEDLRRDWSDTNTVYESYEEAARCNGLLDPDEYVYNCLDEAAIIQMPSGLRSLLATLIVHRENVPVASIWARMKTKFTEDFLARDNCAELAERLALSSIQNEVSSFDPTFSLAKYGFPVESFSEPVSDLREDYLDDQESERLNVNIGLLNRVQMEAFTSIIEAVNADEKICGDCGFSDRLFFVDGPGGTGKTFLFNAIIGNIITMGKNIVPMAYTGAAASLLRLGRTVHSTFKVSFHDPSIIGVSPRSALGRRLRLADVILIDEATLISSTLLKTIDTTLRDLTCNTYPFGGKVVILGGDFRQCLPIIKGANRAQLVGGCLLAHPLWGTFRQIRLTTNVRASRGGQVFADWLRSVGEALSGDCLPIHRDRCTMDLMEMVTRVFGDPIKLDSVRNRCILTTTNESTTQINALILRSFLPGQQIRVYLSVDSCTLQDGTDGSYMFDIQYLNSYISSGLPPHQLELKVGAPVILTRNLSVARGLCNGTKMIVTRLFRFCIEAIPINSTLPVIIPMIKLNENDPRLPFTLHRIQMPLRLAFSLTINKSQGQTFEKVGVDLREPCFGHGQVYVALSRVGREEDIHVLLPKTSSFDESGFTSVKNVVYKELLS